MSKTSSFMNMKLGVEIDGEFQLKKCAMRSFVGDADDLISQLPDDILVHILSFLSLKEAARTSVLSSRWIDLWKHITSLDFDAQSVLDEITENNRVQLKLIESEAPKYVKWVNSVLQSHKSATLKEFRIRFPLDMTAKHSISLWLQFAFAKQVQRLKLELQNYGSSSFYYCFPEEFLSRSPEPKPPSLIFCTLRPLMLENLKTLKELSFKGVHLSGEVIEFFLYNCPLLERLVVHKTDKISNLEVCGPSLRLKHLEIVHCVGLKTLKVSSPNLTSLMVMVVDELLLEHVPMLVEVSVSCSGYNISVKGLISALSCCISQLEILYLELYTRKGIDEVCKFPQMPKLKKLTVRYSAFGHESLVKQTTALIRASPSLEEFRFEYVWCEFPIKNSEVEDVVRFPHHHLKIFKFCGYYYERTGDAELLRYVSENCVVLQKIIIDPFGALVPNRLVVEQTVRENAKQQLERIVPRHVELVIL